MTVQPFDIAGLPEVSVQHAAAVMRAAAHLPQAAETLTVNVTPFGAMAVRCVAVGVPVEPDETDAVWALSRPGGDARLGYLVLDADCALRVLAGTLALPGPRLVRRLGAAERGIVTATITGCFRACGAALKVALGPRRWRADGLARLTMRVDFGAWREHVHLDLPPDWLPEPSATSLAARAGERGLAVSMTLEVGRTLLTAADWSRARPGDAIAFDGLAPLALGRAEGPTSEPIAPDSDRWVGSIVCGEYAASATVAANGRATLSTGFHPLEGGRDDHERQFHVRQDGRDLMSTADREAVSRTVLASAPIEVIAEIGRAVLRADEVLGLGPGSVLEFPPPHGGPVVLRIGDQKWAEGELVTVDGQLGVRLTAMARPAGPAPASEGETLR